MGALQRLGVSGKAKALHSASSEQNQTADSFGFKWAQRTTYESPAMQAFTRAWLLDKYCDSEATRLDQWLSGGRKVILDAGCGAALSAICLFAEHLNEHDYLGVDLSTSIDVARARFRDFGYQGDFLRADIMALPFADSSVDLVFAEGVLHHTDDTAAAIKALAKKLKPGALFLFYVYARKGPVREFTDDLVRNALQPMTDEAAWTALEPITHLGIALGKVGTTVDIPTDIPVLGIKAGPVSVQRLFYYSFLKAYYRPELTFAESHHINFDWFRPANCHRHTAEEVLSFCSDAGLRIERLHSEASGHAVVARLE